MKPNLQFKVFEGRMTDHDDMNLMIEHFISTETQDSGGDIMRADGMKMRGKPVVLFQHGMDPKFGSEPIAKVLDIRVGEYAGKKGLIAKTQYFDGSKLNPPDSTGQRLYAKAKDGTMPNWSIGFNSLKEKPCEGGRVVEEWELHEYSQVAVGMNSEACTLSAAAPELKFIIYKALPEEFVDEKDFLEKTEEFIFDNASEMVCDQEECKTVGEKPYPSEHACRINEPSKFSKFRRQNGAREHDGKKYDVIYGQVKGSDKWDEQAYRYPKAGWSAEAAAAHCKSHEGSFEAAKAAVEPEIKAVTLTSVKRAHKAIHTMHKEMIHDLKMEGERDDLVDAGAEKCAKDALEEFTENARPHAERYIESVRKMSAEDPFGDEDETADDAGEADEKSYTKAHRGLKKCLTDTVKAIRAHKCNKAVVPGVEAERILCAHAEAALPHAKEFIKAWHEKCKEEMTEIKPILKISASSDPADDPAKSKVFSIHTPLAKKLTIAQSAVAPVSVFKLAPGKKAALKVTPEFVRELIASAKAGMINSIRAEMAKAAGKVT